MERICSLTLSKTTHNKVEPLSVGNGSEYFRRHSGGHHVNITRRQLRLLLLTSLPSPPTKQSAFFIASEYLPARLKLHSQSQAVCVGVISKDDGRPGCISSSKGQVQSTLTFLRVGKPHGRELGIRLHLFLHWNEWLGREGKIEIKHK